jgi:hypothetical protein
MCSEIVSLLLFIDPFSVFIVSQNGFCFILHRSIHSRSQTTSAMSKFIVVALAILAATAMGNLVCPAKPATYLYGLPASSCGAFTTCQTAYCTCAGGSVATDLLSCTYTTQPNCLTAVACVGEYVKCLNAAAANGSTCSSLSTLHSGLLNIEAGAAYNTSTAYASCKSFTCEQLNATITSASAAGCTSGGQLTAASYGISCLPTVAFRGILKVSGDGWTAVRTAVGEAALKASFQADMRNTFRISTITVDSVTTGQTRRRSADVVTVAFTALGVSAFNPDLIAGLAAAGKDSTWLSSTTAIYSANGGAGAITVTSVTDAGAAPTPGSPSSTGSGTPTGSGSSQATQEPASSGASLVAFAATAITVMAALLM